MFGIVCKKTYYYIYLKHLPKNIYYDKDYYITYICGKITG